jgi:type VI protein secretion system component Hcp
MNSQRANTLRKLSAWAFAVALWMTFVPCLKVGAASLYLYVPSITGENPTPGYPGAMAVQSLTVTPNGFSVVKNVDKASPTIFSDVTTAELLHTTNVLLYNSPPSGPPNATLAFQNVIASSYLVLGGGITEQDGFNATTPASMYLELPGVTGESTTPGHPGVMQIDSFFLTGNDFSIIKSVDNASPAIESLILTGTPFSTASVLFYNSPPSGQPDAILIFQNVLGSSHQQSSGGDLSIETDTFNFINVVPEPPSTALLAEQLVWQL